MVHKRKVLSLVVCFIVIGLVASLIGGCGPSNGPPANGDEDDTPKYGGILNMVTFDDPTSWDDAIGPHYETRGNYQCLWSGDWTKGIAGGYGTEEASWFIAETNRLEHKTGYIAESWEIGNDYIEFYLREGVRWENRFPTNGREVTADDVVYSIERQMTLITGYLRRNFPATAAAMSVSKVDEGTVRIDCSSEQMGYLLSQIDFMYIYPKDVIEMYGDMDDWERAIGTGPFYVKEYVLGSHILYERNPIYWETYPVIGSPSDGDQLPYLDGVRVLIQTDIATRLSLFMTGQIDIHTVEHEQAQQLLGLSGVKYVNYYSDSAKAVICMRTDKEDKPYSDVRVRQALQLALDNQQMVDQLYGGEGEILYWPLGPIPEYAGAYLPLKDYPDEPVLGPESVSVKDLLGYNIDKAKQLLADAGYPDGFQAEIVGWGVYPYIDQLMVVKDMWEKIGVDLTIKPVDWATIGATMVGRNYDDMCYWGTAGGATYFRGIQWSGTGMWNGSYINDPFLNDYRDQMLAAYPDEAAVDQIHREMLPYLLEQCYVILTAAPHSYRFWWPWVKNYNGEVSIGYQKGIASGFGGLAQYIWIDQELKAQMGY